MGIEAVVQTEAEEEGMEAELVEEEGSDTKAAVSALSLIHI